MLTWEPPVFNSPFELHREEGVLRLVFTQATTVDRFRMKELLRLTAALDPLGRAPMLVECRSGLSVNEEARALLSRACGASGHTLAIQTEDLDMRLQVELFRQVYRPRFALRVFRQPGEAHRWIRERAQLAELVQPTAAVEKRGDILPATRP